MTLMTRWDNFKQLVEKSLEENLPREQGIPPEIVEAMRYSLMGGGKRLRPFLTLAAAEAVGGDPMKALPAAAALEYIHTYSLIHDDLPAMDDDDLRRGRPTSHKVFGEAMAILAGDALLTHAFVILAGMSGKGISDQAGIRVISEIAQAAGVDGMIGGQVVDLQSEGKRVEAEVLDYMHRKKTGALIRASVRTGAILGGADDEQLRALSDYADSFGLAFQITDDILDETGDESQLGKPVGSDAKNQKATFVTCWGLEQSKTKAEQYSDQAQAALDGLGVQGELLRELARFVIQRQG